jgi:membrane associated rhomboid family serine protease/DNA-directed RNA polymerase subunit RPC12/RpoP
VPSSPDLFVVCKNCRAEVSPYITECPYCGHRLRKRAPKLEKGAVPRREGARRAEPPRLGRLRAGEIPGIRTEGPPVVALMLVIVPALMTLLARAGVYDPSAIVMLDGTDGEWWRPLSTTFFYASTSYELCALAAVFLFGWLLERRHGPWVPLVVYCLGAFGGMWVAVGVDSIAFATGANGGALALLAAWAMRDLLAARRGEEIESDLLGVAVVAVVLVLLPAAVEEAHALAGAAGGVIGLLCGALLARPRRAERR